jgi:hypothetical protein
VSAATKACALLAALAGSLAGCLLDIDFDNTKFSCEDGKCPDGFSCVESTCVAESAGDDGGPGGDAGGADGAEADGGPLPTCDEQFGEAVEYMLCAEEADTCEFFVRTEVATACADICPLYGAECVNSFDADAEPCTRVTEDNCTVTHMSQICVCTRG